MDYRFNIPSLEEIAFIKIAIALWNQDDIKALLSIIYKSLDGHMIIPSYVLNKNQIKSAVIRKASDFSQSGFLQQKMLSFVETVGSQIFSWINYHTFLSSSLNLPTNAFCWTNHGTIDLKKTAEVLVGDLNLDISSRFILSCVYCLENDIPLLWNQLPEDFRSNCEKDSGQHRLVVLWTLVLKNELHKLTESSDPYKCTAYQYAFKISVSVCSRAAAEYFLKKMTPKEREESLFRCAKSELAFQFLFETQHFKEITADFLLFLLSELDEQERIEVFKKYSEKILDCFLHWPRQGIFIETANYAWKFLTESEFCHLLLSIINKMMDEDSNYNYRELFGEFWKQSPDSCKKYALAESCDKNVPLLVLSVLFMMEDVKNIRLILKSLTAIQKERFIFNLKGRKICKTLYSDGKWDLLKLFIGECISSENIHFKKELEACLNGKENSEKFLQLIDQLQKRR